jgi:hypothetical protein
MPINRRQFLLLTAAAACARLDSSSPLQRAAQYLWSRQAEDGGFHSSTYGLLRSGQSLTPFVLDALLDLPTSIFPSRPAAVDRALAFIKKNTTADGVLGRIDPSTADYPNYATALAVSAMVKAGRKNVRHDIAPMVEQLRVQQFSEAGGWNPEDAPYGAWGMGGSMHRAPYAGHVDLSMTRYVLEALKAAGVPSFDPLFGRALVYLKRSQNLDGGFYFSTVNPETNKAGKATPGFASYGTTTADGILALRAAGLPETDRRISDAITWLIAHHRPDCAPGFEGTARKDWGSALRFYYASVISRALPDLSVELPAPASDNSYRNTNKMVKEDDPLIATTFALHVLRSCSAGVNPDRHAAGSSRGDHSYMRSTISEDAHV